MGAVRHHQFPCLGIHLQQFGGVPQAGVAVGLAHLAQDERRSAFLPGNGVPCGIHGQDAGHLFVQILLQKTLVLPQVHVQRVVVVGQAVRHHFHVQEFGRKAAEGFNQACIAVNLHIQGEYDAVVRGAVCVEIFVFLAYFLQRIADVKSIFLLLGIQHQGQVVALFDNVHHLLVLDFVIFPLLLPRAVQALVFVIQFAPEVEQRRVQAHAGEYGHGGNGDGKQQNKNADKFPFFHILVFSVQR